MKTTPIPPVPNEATPSMRAFLRALRNEVLSVSDKIESVDKDLKAMKKHFANAADPSGSSQGS